MESEHVLTIKKQAEPVAAVRFEKSREEEFESSGTGVSENNGAESTAEDRERVDDSAAATGKKIDRPTRSRERRRR